jgi:hypothetical protein
MEHLCIGADPAPTKDTVFWMNKVSVNASPLNARRKLADLCGEATCVVLAWDAPLSFQPKYGFSDRPVDYAIRALFREKECSALIANGALAALPFASCPHWSITCATLGVPFGPSLGWRLCDTTYPNSEGRFVVEVNPAVALAFWWLQAGVDSPMPRYKKGGTGAARVNAREAAKNRAFIREELESTLSIPEEACQTDDVLDAWVAWHLLEDFAVGKAALLGTPTEGAYLLPVSFTGKPEESGVWQRAKKFVEKGRHKLSQSLIPEG